jgi:integrase/recombinase XerD
VYPIKQNVRGSHAWKSFKISKPSPINKETRQPLWVKQEIDGWLDVAGIKKGPIFRRVLANGRVGKDALTERAVWQLVREYAAQIGIGELAPHDLRRTAAKLCRAKGGELEQIKFLLGHESILTTERYLGSEQNLKNAVNDALVFE